MLNILSGWETANIKSLPIADGVVFDAGDWAEFDADGKLVKNTSAFDGTKAVFPVYAGNGRFYDTRYLNKVDVVTASSGILETDVIDAVDFKAGDPVFVAAGKLTDGTTAGEGAVAVGYAIEPSGVNVAGKNIVKFKLA